MGGRTAGLLTTALVAVGLALTSPGVAHAEISTECTSGTDTASLNRLVTNQLADLVGFDTTRVIALPDGRNVWTVQDAFLAPTPGAHPSSLRPPTGFAHNALIVQQGTCFTTLHGPITPGSHCSVVQADARAAVIDLAAVDPAGAGFLTAWSCDEAMPPTSNLNYVTRGTRATHAVVTLAGDASICVFSMTATDVLVDVTGSYTSSPSALGFHPLSPTRIYDSRVSGGAWAFGETRVIDVPVAAAAVAFNLTITEPAAAGFVTVFPCQQTLPIVSNINYVPAQVVANLVQIGVTGGQICVHSNARTHIVIDLQGTYDTAPGGLHYQAVAPARLVDTRIGVGSVFGRVGVDAGPLGIWPANAPVATTAVPAAVKALMVSMIAVTPRGPGWAAIGPCLEPAYLVPYRSSTLNFVAADVVANQAITPTGVSSGADICTVATSPAFHVVDLTGWFV